MSLSNRIRLKQNGSSDCVTSLRLDWLVIRGVGERHLGRQLNGHIVHINGIDVLSSRPTLRESSG